MKSNRKYLIVGADGQLAFSFLEQFRNQGTVFSAYKYSELDITDFSETRQVITQERPDVVINCAAYNLVDDAEDDPSLAHAINAAAAGHVADICREIGAFLVHYSSDYVFDGRKAAPYLETDQPNPLNVYGRSKLEGEKEIKKRCPRSLIFRLSWAFGFGKNNFLYKLQQWASRNSELKIVDDEISVPTYTEDTVAFTLAALDRGLTGLYHLTNAGQCSRYEWAVYYLGRIQSPVRVKAVKSKEFTAKAKRPRYSVMSHDKLVTAIHQPIPAWKDAVDRYITKSQSVKGKNVL